MPRHASIRLAVPLLFGLGVAAACGDSERGSQMTGQPAGSAGASGSAAAQAGSSAGGGARSTLGGEAGDAPTAGQPTAGSSAGGAAGTSAGSSAEAGAGGAAIEGSAGAAGACSQACTSMDAGQFCGADEVTWVCNSIDFNVELFNQECRDAMTGAIRYCCPPAFTGECP